MGSERILGQINAPALMKVFVGLPSQCTKFIETALKVVFINLNFFKIIVLLAPNNQQTIFNDLDIIHSKERYHISKVVGCSINGYMATFFCQFSVQFIPFAGQEK